MDEAALPIIEFRNVSKAFNGVAVLRGLSLTVRRGETLTIMGGSGVGKSVLLKLLTGLVEADDGSILVDGIDIVPLADAERMAVRRKVGMLFQGAALFDSLTVFDNVAYPLRVFGEEDEEGVAARVRATLAAVGLRGIDHLRPAELSGGMRKRVGLARAIVHEPAIVLYDEPTTGLDPRNIRLILDLVRRLREHIPALTSIIVTHDIESALAVSDRLAVLSRGRIVASGTPEEMTASPLPEVQDFLAGH